MLENIRLAFQGIWSHMMRSFLTMLGIIIGIASIIAIVSTIKGTSEHVTLIMGRMQLFIITAQVLPFITITTALKAEAFMGLM